ncbi:MAG: RNA polymerase sigma factor [candidate division Zixibacteria bacterium]|nr:RNA polymerase sigma factor [candidate division Zixibacteria bacterium]
MDGDNSLTFTDVFNEYKDRTFDFAVKMLGDRDAAGDIAQEVFVRLYTKMTDHYRITDIKSWLFILTRNLCLNKIRDRCHEVPLSAVSDNPGDHSDRDRHRQIELRRALLALEPEYREALILREYQGFSYTEIAEILGTTVPAIRALLYRARCRLRETYRQTSFMG